ncbi:DUF2798 domain-containing protein [Enterococcus sp.]|uniref:DUF2798 domain-containing protein n=1 Tax=Enterococcus sp. TaxID=35783 RepID=UPI003C71FCA7
MPRNKRESLIYTVLMCSFMVLWMSIYNVALHNGELSWQVVEEAWLGFPIGFVVAMFCDWFVVSGPAKGVAFGKLLKPHHGDLRKVITVSCCMVLPMVFIMSLYGALEVAVTTQQWSKLLMMWLTNIPINLIMALPLQLLIAGPIVRKLFRTAFPEGKVLA